MVAAATTVAVLLIVPEFETTIRRGGPTGPGGWRYSVTPAADLVFAFSRWFRELGWIAVWALAMALALRRRSRLELPEGRRRGKGGWLVITLSLCLSLAISAAILLLVTLALTLVLVPLR